MSTGELAPSPLGEALADRRVVICAGAGGVGKTTVSAAVALGLAGSGKRVALVTIDPARRLAEALGLQGLGNEPQRVEGLTLPLDRGGELWAMMLDVKRTFDELVMRLSRDRQTSEQILSNPIYQHLSSAIAGSQEYTAIAKLFELHCESDFDVNVLDTPPSRNAIDFLQAPSRLLRFLDDRAFRLMLTPSTHLARLAGVVFTALRSITGVELFADLTAFFSELRELLGGFRQRAAETERLLRDPLTAFLLVTTTERAPLQEAIFFADQLAQSGMHSCGVVVNRVHPLDPGFHDVRDTASRLSAALGEPLARKVSEEHANIQVLARRDALALARLRDELGFAEPVCVPDRERDLDDVAGLLDLSGELFALTNGVFPT